MSSAPGCEEGGLCVNADGNGCEDGFSVLFFYAAESLLKRSKNWGFCPFKNFFKNFKKTFKKVLTNEKSCDMIGITQGQEQSPSANANGSIAQLGEHLPYKQRVIGSSPIVPTILAR